MAKKLFEGLNVNYTAVELDVNKNGSQIQDILEQMTGGRTVSVFICKSWGNYKLTLHVFPMGYSQLKVLIFGGPSELGIQAPKLKPRTAREFCTWSSSLDLRGVLFCNATMII